MLDSDNMADMNGLPDKTSTGPAISAIVVVPDRYDELERTIQHLKKQTARFTSLNVPVNKSARRFYSFPGDTSQGECHTIKHTGMEGAMSQNYRVVGGYLIYIPAVGVPFLGKVEIVVIVAGEPFAGGKALGSASDSCLYLRDRANR